MEVLLREVLEAWLYFCPLFHCKCYFVKWHQFMEMGAHSLTACLMCGTVGPQFLGCNTLLVDLKSGNITRPVASGSKEFGFDWKGNLNIKYIR